MDRNENSGAVGRMVLATINFVRASMQGRGEYRFQHRDAWLNLGVAVQKTNCRDCQREIQVGEQAAIGLLREHFCMKCVAWMSEAEALEHSDVRDCAPDVAARLRGEKYGLVSGREFNHDRSVARGGEQWK